jgi:hypothetical protein
MVRKSEDLHTVPKIKPTDEQFFIDRLVEILIMQVEQPNEDEYKRRKITGVHNAL